MPKKSYSQFAEDLLIEQYLGDRPAARYIDIGCLWPIDWSNTYRSYRAGGSGLCIDANPEPAEMFREQRPRDRFFNAGVSSSERVLKYFMFKNPVFNTFNEEKKERVLRIDKPGRHVIAEVDVSMKPLTSILDEVGWWDSDQETDLLCIDVEHHELDVLRSASLDRLRPRLIVMEQVGSLDTIGDAEIVRYVKAFGYSVVGYTGHDVFLRRP